MVLSSRITLCEFCAFKKQDISSTLWNLSLNMNGHYFEIPIGGLITGVVMQGSNPGLELKLGVPFKKIALTKDTPIEGE